MGFLQGCRQEPIRTLTQNVVAAMGSSLRVRSFRREVCAAAAAVTLLAFVTNAAAQQPDRVEPSAIAGSEDIEALAILLRTTLVALHQANVTGNYSVLRDLAAPEFREKNTPADLAIIFAPIREKRIDLAPVVLLEPKLSKPPAIDKDKILHVSGTLATTRPIGFELLFKAVDGVWRMFGVSIAPQEIESTANIPLSETKSVANAGSVIRPNRKQPSVTSPARVKMKSNGSAQGKLRVPPEISPALQ